MKISYMKEYIELADSLNFSKTAKKLLMTQPALSRHLARIEELTGVPLFIRNTHSVEITEAGKEIYTVFSEILAKYDDAIHKLSLESSGFTDECKLGILYYGVETYIEPLLSLMKNNYPNIKLHLFSYQPSFLIEALINGIIDVGQFYYWLPPGSKKFDCEYFGSPEMRALIDEKVHIHPFARENFILIVPLDHPLANEESVSISALNGESIILFENNRFNEHIKQLLLLNGISFKIIPAVGQVDILSYEINETGGIAIQPGCIKFMNRPNLRYIKIDDDAFGGIMSMAYRVDNDNPVIPLLINQIDKYKRV